MAMNYKESDFYYPILSILKDGVEGRSASEILQIIIITKNMDAQRLPELWASYRLQIKNLIRLAKTHLVYAGYILKRIDNQGWHLTDKGKNTKITEQALITEITQAVQQRHAANQSAFTIDEHGKISRGSTRTQLRRKKEYAHGHNIIFYGPPATGKTQEAIDHAILLLNINLDLNQKIVREELFQKHLGDRLEFVTFHQSYTYGHFMQYFDGTTYQDGVFKQMVDRARHDFEAYHYKHHEHAPSIKILLDALWLKHLNKETELIEIELEEAKGYNSMIIFDITDTKVFYQRKTKKDVILDEVRQLDLNKIKTLYHSMKLSNDPLHATYYNAILDALSQVSDEDIPIESFPDTLQNYVIIIDEINQADTLSIFGECVSLLDEDKRQGRANEMFIRLASGERFTLPPNIYIIGTMDTASKVVSSFDIVLKRSFEMLPMYPKYHKEDVAHADFLKALNVSIKEKKGADYMIGQAYFLSKYTNFELVRVLNRKIIPMLNECFDFKLDIVKKILNTALKKASSTSGKYEVEEDEEFFLRAIRSRKR